MAADEAHLEGSAGAAGEADGGGDAGVGHGDDDDVVHAAGDGLLFGEAAAEGLAHLVDAGAFEARVGAGEVDVLEEAHLALVRGEGLDAAEAARVDDDHLARLDVAHELGADEVEADRLAGDDPRGRELVPLVDAAEDEGADAHRITDGDHLALGEEEERVGALDLAERVGDLIGRELLRAHGDEVDDGLGVGGALEDRAARLEALAQLGVVGEVAVVGDGDRAARVVDGEGLHVLEVRAARRGVAHVADGGRAGQRREILGAEDGLDEPHGAVGEEPLAVAGDDARGLLPAVLERVQPEVGEVRRLGVPVNPEDAAHARLHSTKPRAARPSGPRSCLLGGDAPALLDDRRLER